MCRLWQTTRKKKLEKCNKCGKYEADPCWKGYKQIGMKDKDGKQVPNCVPESTEDVALSGDHSRADIDKKKKKIAKVPNGFEFKEALDEHWLNIIQEVRFRAFTHTSSFVGNVRYDQDLQEMTIILNGKEYNFCNVPERKFEAFRGADSKGAYFNRNIRTLHDC